MDSKSITRVLNRQEDTEVAGAMFPEIYLELRKIAGSHRRSWNGSDTINTTALIHEAYLKLGSRRGEYKNRKHFYATAAKVMRQVLVNYAERNGADKRRGEPSELQIESIPDGQNHDFDELLFINEMLHRIEARNSRHCQIVECRIFAGMSIEETAEHLEISTSTVKREWLLVSARLFRELKSTRSPQNSVLRRSVGSA